MDYRNILYSAEAGIARLTNRLQPVDGPQRMKQAGHMVLNGLFSQAQLQSDAFVGQALIQHEQDIKLASRQDGCRWQRGCSVHRHWCGGSDRGNPVQQRQFERIYS